MKAVLSLSLLAVVLSVVGILANEDCGNTSDCIESKQRICALNKEKVCFKTFKSECHMQIEACLNNLELMTYDDSYCNLEGFMCPDESSIYNEDDNN